jgi:hypothetical protein
MSDLPDSLSNGEKARLIPVVADTSKEVRVVSIVLAAMTAVPDLAKVLLGSIGQSIGVRSNLHCFTEVEFKKCLEEKKCRPDGYVLVDGKRGEPWSCIVEAKIGRNELDADQIAQYAAIAKLNGIDAIITISNQFTALPTHHPLRIAKSALKGVELYHWSWTSIVTHIMLLAGDMGVEDQDQQYILEEVLRYLSHESVGITRFDRMNAEWKDLVSKVQSGAPLSKSDTEVERSVAAWEQVTRNASLLMTQKIGTQVRLVLSRAHTEDPALRLRDDCELLVNDNQLRCALDVPDAAAQIRVGADLQRRSISISMELSAPKDKQRASSRINWFIRQLSKSIPDDLYVRSRWPGRAGDTQVSLTEARENPSSLERGREGMVPNSFEVLLVRDLAGKFSGAKTFIEALEEAVPHFYEQVGQHLRPYVATPPKLKEAGQGDISEQSQISSAIISLGAAPPPPDTPLAVSSVGEIKPPDEPAIDNRPPVEPDTSH